MIDTGKWRDDPIGDAGGHPHGPEVVAARVAVAAPAIADYVAVGNFSGEDVVAQS